jgi:hypothetical protein
MESRALKIVMCILISFEIQCTCTTFLLPVSRASARTLSSASGVASVCFDGNPLMTQYWSTRVCLHVAVTSLSS